MYEYRNRLEMSGIITGYIQNKLIAFHIKSKIHTFDATYTIEGNDNKSTITVEATINWKFPMNMMSIFIGQRIKENILKQTEAEFAELVILCETEHNSILMK
jgi:hypothetical protein